MKRSWRAVLGELLLIFVGISLALFVENWSEERQERVKERVVLSQILTDIRATRLNVTRGGTLPNTGLPTGNLPGAEAGQAAHRRIMQTLYGSGSVDLDSIALDFDIVVNTGSPLFVQTAGYESLKSIGVDLLSNDSLRVNLTSFFDVTLPRIAKVETYFRESREQFLAPYVFEHFRALNPLHEDGPRSSGFRPLDLADLRDDPAFPLIMDRVQRERGRMIRFYRRADSEMDALIAQLESWLDS